MQCVCCFANIELVYDMFPNDAVACNSQGNYGSTVFDSLTGEEQLEFVMCDSCLKDRLDRNIVKIFCYPYPTRERYQKVLGAGLTTSAGVTAPPKMETDEKPAGC